MHKTYEIYLKDFKYIHFSWRTYKISDKNLIHVHRDVLKHLGIHFNEAT